MPSRTSPNKPISPILVILVVFASACSADLYSPGAWHLEEAHTTASVDGPSDGCIYVGGLDRLRIWGEVPQPRCIELGMISPTGASETVDTSGLAVDGHWEVIHLIAYAGRCQDEPPTDRIMTSHAIT